MKASARHSLCLLSCLGSGAVRAESTAAALGSQLFTVVVSLAVVIGAIFACAWLVRRYGGGARLPGQRVRTLATVSVGTRERVVLIEVNGAQLLLGVAPGNVRSLHFFGADAAPVGADAATFAGTFAEQLRSGGPARGTTS